jgi:glycosyltransferase involved in cell wall biosynthesis
VKTYILTSCLPRQFGGRTKSLLRRAQLLYEAGLEIAIVSTNYNHDYEATYADYRERGYVPGGVPLINVYDAIASLSNEAGRPRLRQPIRRPALLRLPRKGEHHYFNLAGRRTHRVCYYDNSRDVRVMDHYQHPNKHRILRQEFDRAGVLRREVRAAEGTPSSRVQHFYDSQGHSSLLVRSRLVGDNWLDTEILETRSGQRHSSRDAFLTSCLARVISPGSNVICDARGCDRLLLACDGLQLRRFFVFHNPHTVSGKLKRSFRQIYRQQGKAEAVVLLTERQKKDWSQLAGRGNAVCIPHSITAPTPSENEPARSPTRIVCVARLAPQKRLDHAIKAFGLVLARHPEATLEIYGSGPCHKKLARLIRTLGIGHSCWLQGKTDSPTSVFRSAACSLNTSTHEGQPLAILESLACGCPVVSYDICYGPSDMIVDGESGFLLRPDDIHGLAAAIGKVLDGARLRAHLPDRFSDSVFIRSWSQLLGAAPAKSGEPPASPPPRGSRDTRTMALHTGAGPIDEAEHQNAFHV